MYKYLIFFLFLFSCQNAQETIGPKCENGLVFQFKSGHPLNTRLYDCELIDAESGLTIRQFKSLVNADQFVKVKDLPQGLLVKLKVKDSESNVTAISNPVESCGELIDVIDVSNFVAPKPTKTGVVKVTLLFPCAEIDTKKLPASELYSRFKLSGTNEWKDLPVLKYGTGESNYFSITTNLLSVGKTYDFKVGGAPGYYAFEQENVIIDSEDWVILIGTQIFCK